MKKLMFEIAFLAFAAFVAFPSAGSAQSIRPCRSADRAFCGGVYTNLAAGCLDDLDLTDQERCFAAVDDRFNNCMIYYGCYSIA